MLLAVGALFDMVLDPFLHVLARNRLRYHRRGCGGRRGSWCGRLGPLRQGRGGQRQQCDDGCRTKMAQPIVFIESFLVLTLPAIWKAVSGHAPAARGGHAAQ
jgi:hypothetical protein